MVYEWGWGAQPDEYLNDEWIDQNGEYHNMASRIIKARNKNWSSVENSIGKSYDDFTDEDYENIPF